MDSTVQDSASSDRSGSPLPGTIGEMLAQSARQHNDHPALTSPTENGNVQTLTYQKLLDTVDALALGLGMLGLEQGDRVALLSKNRWEWLASDLAVLSWGAVDVPRSSDTPPGEVEYILHHAGVSGLIVDRVSDLEALRLSPGVLENLTFIVSFEGKLGLPNAHRLENVIESGRRADRKARSDYETRRDTLDPESPATIIYTPGTTGRPKGVLLSHGNILHNIRVLPGRMGLSDQDRFLSILPSWHTFERVVEYVLLFVGGEILYAPRKTRAFLESLTRFQPTAVAGVPRIWEKVHRLLTSRYEEKGLGVRLALRTALGLERFRVGARRVIQDRVPQRSWGPIHPLHRMLSRFALLVLTPVHALIDASVLRPIRDAFGGRLRIRVSGGGSLPPHIDDFFEALGMPLQEGYGMTETSPVVSVRRPGREVARTAGRALEEVEVRVVRADGSVASLGEQGRIKVRGPNVMKGYYQDDGATRAVLAQDGWLDTGDLGRLTETGDLQICGREKDTIVLLSGENVEPVPIEHKILESPLVSQAVVVGQDSHKVGCLLVLDEGIMTRLNSAVNRPAKRSSDFLRSDWVRFAVRQEIDRLISKANGFKRHELVADFAILKRGFKVGEELTATLKIRRKVVFERHRKAIQGLRI